MGNTGCVIKKWTHQERVDPDNSVIISDELRQGAEMLSTNKKIQDLFLVYFLSGSWVGKFLEDKGRITWDILVKRNSREGISMSFSNDFERKNTFRSFAAENTLKCESERDDLTSSVSKFRSSFIKLIQQDTNMISLFVACAFPYFLQSHQNESALSETPRLSYPPSGTSTTMNNSRRRNTSMDDDNSTIAPDNNTIITDKTMWSMSFQIVNGNSPDKNSQRTVPYSTGLTTRLSHTNNNDTEFVSFTRCMNTSFLQPMIVDRLSKLRCVDVYQLFSEVWLSQILRLLLDLPYAISIAEVSTGNSTSASSPNFQMHREQSSREHAFPIIYANHAYEQLMQFKHVDLIGFNINCLFDSSVAGDEAVDAFENSLEEMKAFQTLMKMERRSGEIVDTWLATCPVYNTQQQAYTHLVMVHQVVSPLMVMPEVASDMEALLCLISAVLQY